MFPTEFVNILKDQIGGERAAGVMEALERDPLVSIRVNPFKMTLQQLRDHFGPLAGEPVEWAADEAFYLVERPSFTLDPLFHAGGYYVQEASSMYVGQLFDEAAAGMGGGALKVLDLCAAPGGKTTQLLSHMTRDSVLYANEVISSRVPILAENAAKWGCPNVVVTNSDASVFGAAAREGARGGGVVFDIVVVDAPCSGEGMFRKGDAARDNWSEDNVNLCAARQRRILSDMWDALKPGGYLIYSTCTFNRSEDEDNVSWICSELGAETLKQRHFYPGEDKGEGFFAALLRKNGEPKAAAPARQKAAKGGSPYRIYRTMFPEADLALSTDLDRSKYEVAELSREDALKFLAREPLVFADRPLGLILLTYKGLGLGFVKNLGRRSNSLHPMPRRIRNLGNS